jgi:hypothetical protein
MAYNVIKGNIEFSGDGQGKIEDMVDDHSDQTIAGIKTFSGMVTASVGLSASVLHGDGSNLTGITAPAIVTYDGAATGRVIVGGANSNAVSGAHGLSFSDSSLTITGDVTASVNVSASAFHGNGNALLNIGATSLNLGQGIENDGSNNIRVKLDSAPAIARGAGGIKVDLSGLTTIASGDLQTSDTMLVSDSGVNKSITMANLTTYFDNTIADTSPAGANTQIQFNNSGDFGASSNLTFNSSTNVFTTVTGSFTGDLDVSGDTTISSSVTIVTNSTDAIPQLHIHENDTEYGRISFTNNADTSGSIIGYSHEWTLAASSSASGSQTDARFNIFYGDAQGDGNGLDLLGMNGIGDTAIKGTLALNCYQEDGVTTKTDPSTLVGHAHIYSKLVTGHAEMFVRDSNGNVTQISPHTPEGEWQYFSKNTRTGKVVRVNMEKMIRKLEQITGESFMEEWYEDPTD